MLILIFSGFSVLAWLQISQGSKEGKEEKKGKEINDDLEDNNLTTKIIMGKAFAKKQEI